MAPFIDEKDKHSSTEAVENVDHPKSLSADGDLQWTKHDESRIRRRMDARIVPTVFVLYLLCFVDRANIGNARIQGMEQDLGLKGFQFNWALTIFYISCMSCYILPVSTFP